MTLQLHGGAEDPAVVVQRDHGEQKMKKHCCKLESGSKVIWYRRDGGYVMEVKGRDGDKVTIHDPLGQYGFKRASTVSIKKVHRLYCHSRDFVVLL